MHHKNLVSSNNFKNLLCSWEAPSVSDYQMTSYELSYKLVDQFDYYPGYGEVLGIFTLLFKNTAV